MALTVQVHATGGGRTHTVPPHAEMVLRHGILPRCGEPQADLRRHPGVRVPFARSGPADSFRSDLERAVENLSQMLDESVEASTVKNLRSRMVDKTVRSVCIISTVLCLTLFPGVRPWQTRDSAQRHSGRAGGRSVGMERPYRIECCEAPRLFVWSRRQQPSSDELYRRTII